MLLHLSGPGSCWKLCLCETGFADIVIHSVFAWNEQGTSGQMMTGAMARALWEEGMLISVWINVSERLRAGFLLFVTGVGCHSLFQGIFPTWGLNPGFLHCRQILYHLSHQGSPFVTRIAKKSQLDCSLEPKTPVKQEDPGACSVPLFQGWASSADTRRSSTAVSRKHASLWAAQAASVPIRSLVVSKKKEERDLVLLPYAWWFRFECHRGTGSVASGKNMLVSRKQQGLEPVLDDLYLLCELLRFLYSPGSLFPTSVI